MDSPVKPRLRGWSHAVGTAFALAGAGVLIMLSRQQPAKAVTMAIYGLSLVLLLAVSAVYHIGTWRPKVRAILRGVDHANIFLFIAASYTAIVFNAVTGYWRIGILVSIWLLAVVGMATLTGAIALPRWAVAALYVAPQSSLASPIAAQLGAAIDDGPMGPIIRTDGDKMTTVPGLYAAGDIARAPSLATGAFARGGQEGAERRADGPTQEQVAGVRVDRAEQALDAGIF